MLEENCGEIEEEVLNKFKVEDSKKRSLQREEVHLGSGEMFEEARDIGLVNGAKIAGQEFSRGSESLSCDESKACRKIQRRRTR